MPTAHMDESPLRSVGYLQLPLKLMDIAGAQHCFKGWSRETGSTLTLKKTCKQREVLKERKFAEAPYIPFFTNPAPVEGTGVPCAREGCTPETPLVLPSGLPFKGIEVKKSERCLPGVTSAGRSIACTSSLHTVCLQLPRSF